MHPQESHLTNGNIVQVIGKVNPDLTVKVLNSKDLGPDVGKSHNKIFFPPASNREPPRFSFVKGSGLSADAKPTVQT